MEKIYISLTTHPPRIPTLHHTIDTLLRQIIQPNGIYLFLSKLQFPNGEEDLTPQLLEQTKKGLTIEFCDDDLRQHKKYYYIMQMYPNDIIIIVDDDMYYPLNLISRLYESYTANPHAIHAMCVRQLEVNDEKTEILSHKFCINKFAIGVPSMKLMSVGFGGTLYPPNSLHPEVFNLEVLKQMGTDDYWLKTMQIMNNTPLVAVDSVSYKVKFSKQSVQGSQVVAMKYTNLYQNKYDFFLAKMLQLYNEYHGKNDTLVSRVAKHLPAPLQDNFVGDIKISVIIFVNAENIQHLSTCLSRIVNQTLQDIEIICNIDKNDEVAKIVKTANDNRIKISTTKKHMGKYVMFLQVNDFCEPNTLELLYNQAEQDEADIAVCNLRNYENGILSYNDSNREMYKLNILPFSHRDLKEIAHYNLSNEVIFNKLIRLNFLRDKQIENKITETGFGFILMLKADRITMVDDFLITKISGETLSTFSTNSTNSQNFETPLFSVAIFVGDSKEFIKDCLLSIVNQSLRAIEIICINCGATAESWAVAEEFAQKDSRFVLLNGQNLDIGKAVCEVAKIAKGEYLQFVDSADLLAWCAFEHLHQKCNKSQNLEMLFHREKIFFDSAKAFAKYPTSLVNPDEIPFEKATTSEEFIETISTTKNFILDIKFCCIKTNLLKSTENPKNIENLEGGVYHILLDLLSNAKTVDFHAENLYLQRVSVDENLWSSLYALHTNIANLGNLIDSYKMDETLAESNQLKILQNTRNIQRNIFRKLYETLPNYKQKSSLNVPFLLDSSQKELIIPIIAELFVAKTKNIKKKDGKKGFARRLKKLKVVRFFQCWSDHGFNYTVYRAVGKIKGTI
ncbi:MAG: glycosyltransferase [Firmicutes bacterium]|nr:glycosyltransferase [Bacillota bacterium]